MTHQGYGFCEFLTEEDADYACKIMNQIKLFGKPIRVNMASRLPRSRAAFGARADRFNLPRRVHRLRVIGNSSTLAPTSLSAT